jgi:tRNA threonylcarbamoyladenosine biosynthesis protein TsaE
MIAPLFLADEAATLALGQHIATVTGGRGLVTLKGDLGSGKTTLSRGLIRALGHTGAVKSPTFTLVEPYDLGSTHVLHYDLYRLNDPEELHFLGVRDFLDENTLTLVEWPERGRHWLPAPDLAMHLAVSGSGRQASWQAHTPRGEQWSLALEQLTQSF